MRIVLAIALVMRVQPNSIGPQFLGIEGGATQTTALLVDGQDHELKYMQLGPANLQFLSEAKLIRLLRSIARAMPSPQGVGIGLAGAWGQADQARITRAAAAVWPGVPCWPTHDLETAIRAAGSSKLPSVLVISGTGSGCYGKTGNGDGVKIGGWGHLLGDQGSGYDIGLRALQSVILHFDRTQTWPMLGTQILLALQLNEPGDLIAWAQSASKPEISRLALEVFACWLRRDPLAREIVLAAAKALADAAVTCAQRIRGRTGVVRFVFSGGVLVQQPLFARMVGQQIRKRRWGSQFEILTRKSVWGAVELAKKAAREAAKPFPGEARAVHSPPPSKGLCASELGLRSTQLSPTEARNPRSAALDQLSWSRAIELMLSEDASVPSTLKRYHSTIEKVGKAVVSAFRRGGRLFYVGAGTSGRLGVLDASECPPTFRVEPNMVQGIIAGGSVALWDSVEGAEDDIIGGEHAIEFRGVTGRDLVLGIAASGTTPFVWGALRAAKRIGATTVLLCFNPYLSIPAALRPNMVLAPDLGPELLTGSTRLKAGTATKLLLNLFTTLSMVKLGKVMSNLMVDMNPANTKLRDRAVRIVQAIAGVDYATAQRSLETSGWQIRAAVSRLHRRGAIPGRETFPGDTRR